MNGAGEPLLRVEDLRVEIPTEDGTVHAVDGVSFEVGHGGSLGIVGESGSGKTVAALTTIGLTRRIGARISGRILFEGRDLLALSEGEMRAIRGNEIAMVFQDPLSSLHPLYRIGSQLAEAVHAHRDVSKREGRARAEELLEQVGMPEAGRRVDEYPHELSGGMRQRAMIAMALANDPKVLIADEPTTALDVTVQAQILALLERLRSERGMAIVMITHDLGVVADTAEEIAVMYAGRIVEKASTEALFAAPEHPYTWGLLKSIPTLDGPREERLTPIPGRPPSLIDRPSGCHFHPRCPYARPVHARVDPLLQATSLQATSFQATSLQTTSLHATAPQATPGPSHEVACLLEARTRGRLWEQLRAGRTPQEALAAVGASLGENAEPGGEQ